MINLRSYKGQLFLVNSYLNQQRFNENSIKIYTVGIYAVGTDFRNDSKRNHNLHLTYLYIYCLDGVCALQR